MTPRYQGNSSGISGELLWQKRNKYQDTHLFDIINDKSDSSDLSASFMSFPTTENLSNGTRASTYPPACMLSEAQATSRRPTGRKRGKQDQQDYSCQKRKNNF